jgi:hypothetical protein
MSEPPEIEVFSQKIWIFQKNSLLLHQIIISMMRKLLHISAILALLLVSPVSASAAPNYEAGVLEYRDLEPSVTYAQGILYVNGGEGKTLEVISLTGRKVMEEQIDSPAQKFELNIPKGCYIVKVGNVVRKISVR